MCVVLTDMSFLITLRCIRNDGSFFFTSPMSLPKGSVIKKNEEGKFSISNIQCSIFNLRRVEN